MNQFYYANDDGTAYRAPRWWLGYTAGALLVVLGIVGPCGGFWLMVYSVMETTGPSITPPGQVDVPLKRSEHMVIWVQEQDDAMQGDAPKVPADFEAVVKGPGGTPIASRTPTEELTSETTEATRTGAATFIAPAGGTYSVSVKGTFTMGQTVVVTPSDDARDAAIGLGFLLLGLLSLLMVCGGVAMLIITGLRHSRAGPSPV